ncbi:hypothetical protein [Olleya sp. R77988]|uniref:hypothetical protein n=1 Tax=Olleya sp. R77988 TaxID=3093875 RepID=UPI0037C740F1
MPEQLITIKTVDLKNNCPECFSKDGLKLTFKQRFIETALYKSITKEVSTELNCTVCNTAIFPARWTDDIERVYDYQMKAFKPKKESRKYKGLFWVLIIGFIAIIAGIISLLVYKL